MEINVKAEPGYRVEPRILLRVPVNSYVNLQSAEAVSVGLSLSEANSLIAQLSKAVVEAQR